MFRRKRDQSRNSGVVAEGGAQVILSVAVFIGRVSVKAPNPLILS